MCSESPGADCQEVLPADDLPQALLDNCPVCDYRLEGLPAEYACPECGLALDRRWRLFGGPYGDEKARRRDLRAGRLLGVLPIVMTLPLVTLFSFRWNWVARYGVLVLVGALLVLHWWYLLSPKRVLTRAFVGVGPEGVVLHRPRHEPQRFTWDQVLGMEITQAGRLVLWTKRGDFNVHLGDPSHNAAIACRGYVSRCLAERRMESWGYGGGSVAD